MATSKNSPTAGETGGTDGTGGDVPSGSGVAPTDGQNATGAGTQGTDGDSAQRAARGPRVSFKGNSWTTRQIHPNDFERAGVDVPDGLTNAKPLEWSPNADGKTHSEVDVA